MATLQSADDDTKNRTRPLCWLAVFDVVGAWGGTGDVLEEAEVDSDALVGAVRPGVVHDLHTVLVGDLVLHAVKDLDTHVFAAYASLVL